MKRLLLAGMIILLGTGAALGQVSVTPSRTYVPYTVFTTPYTSAPSVEGSTGFNFSTHAPVFYNGTSWLTLLTTAGAGTVFTAAPVIQQAVITAGVADAPMVGTAVGAKIIYNLTVNANITTNFPAPTGTPTDGQQIVMCWIDSGGPRTVSGWNAIYKAGDMALPLATTASKTMYMVFTYQLALTQWKFTGYSGNF